MSLGSKIAIGMGISFVTLIVAVVLFVFSAKFTAEEYENGIEATYLDMQNVYANSIVQILKGKAEVVDKYKGDLLEVVKANMARYAKDENLLFKSVAETAGLTLTPELYKDIQKSIEIGYTEFKFSQKTKIDKVRVYKNFLNASFKGMVAKMFGYPSEKAKEIMEKLITNKDTKETFRTGEMEDLNLFKKSN